jgi:glycosyltransferase involved in cell wall biosynthesis
MISGDVVEAGGGPLVTVIVPVFNGRDYLNAAIESVLAQTVGRLEVVVVDDGSTDGSGEAAVAIAGRDRRVRVLRQENRGLSSARNTGLRAARAQYVAFLDSDDLWLPHKLERQLPLLAPHRVVFGDAFLIRDAAVTAERVLGPRRNSGSSLRFEEILDRNPVPVLTAILSRDTALAVGGFDEDLRSVEDWDLWLRLAARGGVEFVAVHEPVAHYRVNPVGLSSDRVGMARWRLRVLEKLARGVSGAMLEDVGRRAKAERQLLAGELRLRAWESAAVGSFSRSRTDLLEAIRMAPRGPALVATIPLLLNKTLLRHIAVRRLRNS